MHSEFLYKLLAIAFAAIVDQIAEFASDYRESFYSTTLSGCYFA